MSVLLLRLAGPMQSWGTRSRFSNRDTGLEPSKSGVIGLLCAALGWQREKTRFRLAGRNMTIEQLAQSLKMAVRVDREGRMSRDFHTAGGEHRAGSALGFDKRGRPRPYGVARADGSKPGTVTSDRYYLADADFLVGLEGDLALLQELHAALVAPVWPLYLGRKSFVPGRPVSTGPPVEGELCAVLQAEPWPKRYPWEADPKKCPEKLRRVQETRFGEGPEVRQDVPLSFAERRFTIRHVRTDFVPVPVVEDDPCI